MPRPGGAPLGAGESSSVPGTAIANAIFDATGVRASAAVHAEVVQAGMLGGQGCRRRVRRARQPSGLRHSGGANADDGVLRRRLPHRRRSTRATHSARASAWARSWPGWRPGCWAWWPPRSAGGNRRSRRWRRRCRVYAATRRTRTAAGGAGQLRALPHRAGRCAADRRAADRDAVRHPSSTNLTPTWRPASGAGRSRPSSGRCARVSRATGTTCTRPSRSMPSPRWATTTCRRCTPG